MNCLGWARFLAPRRLPKIHLEVKPLSCRGCTAFGNGEGGRVIFGVTPPGWGRGTLEIARLVKEAELDSPDVIVRSGAVDMKLSLPKPGKTPASVVLRLLKSRPSPTVPELAQSLGKSERTAHRAIKLLREAGRLERVGPAKGGHWRVIE